MFATRSTDGSRKGTVDKAMGAKNRGTRRIPIRVGVRTNRERGRSGGRKQCGRGVSVEQVKRKEKWLLQLHRENGELPGPRYAFTHKKISRCLYYRVKHDLKVVAN